MLRVCIVRSLKTLLFIGSLTGNPANKDVCRTDVTKVRLRRCDVQMIATFLLQLSLTCFSDFISFTTFSFTVQHLYCTINDWHSYEVCVLGILGTGSFLRSLFFISRSFSHHMQCFDICHFFWKVFAH